MYHWCFNLMFSYYSVTPVYVSNLFLKPCNTSQTWILAKLRVQSVQSYELRFFFSYRAMILYETKTKFITTLFFKDPFCCSLMVSLVTYIYVDINTVKTYYVYSSITFYHWQFEFVPVIIWESVCICEAGILVGPFCCSHNGFFHWLRWIKLFSWLIFI